MDLLNQSFVLPCGQKLSNRLVKSAMTERLSDRDYAPNNLHDTIYRRWAAGGTGLLITGNMLVDARYLESAGNIAPLVGDQRSALEQMAQAAQSGGGKVWVQLNHAGRQANRFSTNHPVSASSVGLNKLGFFARPRALREEEIEELIKNYARCSQLLKSCGFDGIQVHSAHGYLLSQFLSPLTNHRTDSWGGSLENRARLLLEIVRVVRRTCGPDFPVSVKLNSADFQRGGFGEDDSRLVIHWLEQEGLDLLEISGGTYEKLAFFDSERESTRKREAFFAEFARQVKMETSLPILLTGGFKTRAGCEQALEEGVTDFIGMARPYLIVEDFGRKFLTGELDEVTIPRVKVGMRNLDDLAEAGYWDAQLDRLAHGLAPDPNLSGWTSFGHILRREAGKAFAKRLAGASLNKE